MPRSGANKQPPTVRARGAACWFEAQGDLQRAADLFAEHCGSDVADRPGQFCRNWATRFLDTGSVLDAPRGGRPRLVAPADALQAAAVFKAGLSKKREDGFTSIEEAVACRPELEALLQTGTPQVLAWLAP